MGQYQEGESMEGCVERKEGRVCCEGGWEGVLRGRMGGCVEGGWEGVLRGWIGGCIEGEWEGVLRGWMGGCVERVDGRVC